MGSQATRDADAVLFTRAGLEIGVAATKTFVSQVAAMYLLGLWLAQDARHAARDERIAELIAELKAHAVEDRGDDRARSTSGCRRSPAQPPRAALLPLPRPQHRPARLPRGRAEDEGDLLHPHRRLRGRRDEARPDRAARRVDARSSASRPTARSWRRCSPTSRRSAPAAPTWSRSPPRAPSRSPRSPTRRSTCPRTDWVLQPILAILPLQLLAYYIARLQRAQRRPAAQPGEDGHRRVATGR